MSTLISCRTNPRFQGQGRPRGSRKRSEWRACGDPHSGKKSAEVLLPNSEREVGGGGKSRGDRAARGAPSAQTHAPPGPKPLAAPEAGRPFPEGLRAELSKACRTSGLTMTLLSASNASAYPRTDRPPALGAGSPPGLRSPAEGKRFEAPRVSACHSQPCGSRTRRSCCNQSQDRPIVLARSRLPSPGSARPGRP